MALNDNAVLVVGAGNYFTNPTINTVLPADLLLPNAGITGPDTPWENVGHTSIEDILSLESDGGDATVLATLQNKALRTTYSSRTEALKFTVNQFDTKTLKLYYGSNAPTLPDGTIGVPLNPVPTVAAFLAIFVDGDNLFAVYAPKAEIFRADDLAVKDAESLAGLPLAVKPLQYASNTWAYAVTPLGDV